MDQLMVDCGDLDPRRGTRSCCSERRGATRSRRSELAEHAGTIAYEIVGRIGARVPRRYVP